MKREVKNIDRHQLGKYLQQIAKEEDISNSAISKNTSLTREQVGWVMRGMKNYTIDTFLEVITALDCYFFLANKEDKHLDFEDIKDKADPKDA